MSGLKLQNKGNSNRNKSNNRKSTPAEDVTSTVGNSLNRKTSGNEYRSEECSNLIFGPSTPVEDVTSTVRDFQSPFSINGNELLFHKNLLNHQSQVFNDEKKIVKPMCERSRPKKERIKLNDESSNKNRNNCSNFISIPSTPAEDVRFF